MTKILCLNVEMCLIYSGLCKHRNPDFSSQTFMCGSKYFYISWLGNMKGNDSDQNLCDFLPIHLTKL